MNISVTEVVRLSSLLRQEVQGGNNIKVVSKLLSSDEIKTVLYNREPSLLLNRAVMFSEKDSQGAERFRAITETVITEEHCHGHYPGYPIFPFAQVAEIVGQSGCLLLSVVKKEEFEGTIPLAVKSKEFRSGNSGPVIPGDVLYTLTEITRCRIGFAQISGIIIVREEVVATMDELSYLAVKLSIKSERRPGDAASSNSQGT